MTDRDDPSDPTEPWWEPFPVRLTEVTTNADGLRVYSGVEQAGSPGTGGLADAPGGRVFAPGTMMLLERNNRLTDVSGGPVVLARFRVMAGGKMAWDFDAADVACPDPCAAGGCATYPAAVVVNLQGFGGAWAGLNGRWTIPRGSGGDYHLAGPCGGYVLAEAVCDGGKLAWYVFLPRYGPLPCAGGGGGVEAEPVYVAPIDPGCRDCCERRTPTLRPDLTFFGQPATLLPYPNRLPPTISLAPQCAGVPSDYAGAVAGGVIASCACDLSWFDLCVRFGGAPPALRVAWTCDGSDPDPDLGVDAAWDGLGAWGYRPADGSDPVSVYCVGSVWWLSVGGNAFPLDARTTSSAAGPDFELDFSLSASDQVFFFGSEFCPASGTLRGVVTDACHSSGGSGSGSGSGGLPSPPCGLGQTLRVGVVGDGSCGALNGDYDLFWTGSTWYFSTVAGGYPLSLFVAGSGGGLELVVAWGPPGSTDTASFFTETCDPSALGGTTLFSVNCEADVTFTVSEP